MSIDVDITFRSRVLCVYTGKQGCMCGCKGKYRYTALTRAEAGQRRGYEVSDDEINEGVVSRVINKVRAAENVEVADGLGDEVIYLLDDPETGRRVAIYAIKGA
jgi:hypothetical protein